MIVTSNIARALWKASEDPDFRHRTLANLGMALAEEGFILTDAEIAILRSYWEPLGHLSQRAAYERITALARSNPRL